VLRVRRSSIQGGNAQTTNRGMVIRPGPLFHAFCGPARQRQLVTDATAVTCLAGCGQERRAGTFREWENQKRASSFRGEHKRPDASLPGICLRRARLYAITSVVPAWAKTKQNICRQQRLVGCLNEIAGNAFSIMPKNKSATGPMIMQPIERPSILPTQVRPTLPAVGVNKAPLPKQKPTTAEAVRAAKAEITRRESLRKQRQALKA
jgi:hypothetical protein